MATAITLRGFDYFGRSVTPIFLSMRHFLYRFSMFCEEYNFFFAKRPIEFRSLSYAAVSNASSRVKVCENDGNI